MIVNNEKRKVIKWDVPAFGVFEATIWNNKLTDFRACENGSTPTIRSENVYFLERLKDSLEDLLDQWRVSGVGQREKDKE